MASDKSNMEGLGMTLQPPDDLVEPAHLEEKDEGHAYSLCELSEEDRWYKEISIDFENAGLKVEKIEKLSNLHLWKKFTSERTLLLEQRHAADPGFKLNDKYLYHGTSVNKNFICEEGLDSRMSKQGCFGKGIYFSDYPKKCLKYAEKGKQDESFILLMRVILGESKVYVKGAKDKKLVREPEKTGEYTGFRFYDSVEGCPTNHKEFVVYESRRALVECLITYSIPEDPKVRRQISEPVATEEDDGDESPIEEEDVVVHIDSDFSDPDSEYEQEKDENDPDGEDSSDDEAAVKEFEESGEGVEGENEEQVSYEDVIKKKKEEFSEKTGATDEHVIDHCLLVSNLAMDKAIKIFNDMPKDKDLIAEEEKKPKPETPSQLESEIQKHVDQKNKESPFPDSDGWDQLSAEDKEAIIQELILDFLHVTGLAEEETDYAKKCLSAVKLNLDQAILAHYEEML